MAKVLVIEDDDEVTFLVRLLLEGHGHEVVVANDGSRGFAAARRQSPDVIVLDLMMPVMDGFAVLGALQADDRTTDVPVVVLTALATEASQERCYRLGAKMVLTKPFDPSLLPGFVAAVLSASSSLNG